MGNSQGKPVEFDGEANLNHFRLLRVVGRGAFGKVRIVERKDTGLSFALKYIRKDEVVRSESVRNIIRERRMLEHVNHPFICNLRYSFQDIEYMYLVVDLMSGGDLRFHISRKTFTEDAVRFWISELGCALRYIHGQNIIHRDVKPDNVLLDADGHVHLTDFNVASDVVPGRILSSKSGTLAYLAPEVYAGQGYDVRADWWSLGVLFYECIYNRRPFEGNSEASLGTVIQAANPKYPVTSPPVSLLCLYAIKDALEVNPDKRLGSTWESFTRHDFFSCIDFEALERKEIEPVFVPSSEKTNFDATYDLEELLLEEAPLEARARRQKPRDRLKEDATVKEIREEELYRMIETDFRPFDYTLAAYKKITAQVEGQQAAGCPVLVMPDEMHAPQALTTDEATPVSQMTTNGATKQPSLQSQPASETPPGQENGAGPPNTHKLHPPSISNRRLPSPLQPYPQAYTNNANPGRPGRGGAPGMIVESPTGGVQVTLDGGGSWSDLARQDATLPADASGTNHEMGGKLETGGGGVFGFLSRKKGRANSPKPKERGVLGKEGARVVIG
ncbi:putative agc yank protein kinase [Phialemonium atrogriseum]|uniref:Agc yank protein kinase n=1 Tax=Phialemonium atrogriseum TaxID=1093897 RepID=A0AAJ0C922_9PEZI|nr:putative agc yank protein kinase [Phialemonium atrogriseum]KAK1771767.1 putative agc yank protein kinase [Phialemonium atrogriseum]